MARNRTSSVANLAAMFENGSKKQEIKPMEKVKAKKHALSKKFENIFKVKQPELMQGPRKELKDWEAENDEQKIIESTKLNPGRIDHNFGKNTEGEYELHRPTVKKLSLDNQFAEELNLCLTKDSRPEEVKEEEEVITEQKSKEEIEKQKVTSEEEAEESNDNLANSNETEQKIREEMMTCQPAVVVPPEVPQQPKQGARAYFSDLLVGPYTDYPWSLPYNKTCPYSDYVGEGSYPNNREAFPTASRDTFDGIAIDSNTRVILWEKPNFQGKVLLDEIGPKIINNVRHKVSYGTGYHDEFKDAELEANYPKNVRIWSEICMNSWTTGSVKIVAAP